MWNIVKVIEGFKQSIRAELLQIKIKKAIKAHHNNSLDISHYSSEDLDDMVRGLKIQIIKSEEMRNTEASILAMHLRMELLRRGVMPPSGTGGEEVTLLRWWYLHGRKYPHYASLINEFQYAIHAPHEDNRYLFKLLTNASLSQEDWNNIVPFFSNHYECYFYREQGRFVHCDVTTIPTDLIAGQAVWFREERSVEQVRYFLYAVLNYCCDQEITYEVEELLNDNLWKEIEGIYAHHYSDEEIIRLCDFFVNPGSSWRLWFEHNPDPSIFKVDEIVLEETNIHF